MIISRKNNDEGIKAPRFFIIKLIKKVEKALTKVDIVVIINIMENEITFSNIIEHSKYVEKIRDEQLKSLVIDALSMWGTPEKLDEATKVADVLIGMLKKKKQIIEGQAEPAWVDVMIASALLHNLFYTGKLSTLLHARDNLAPLGYKYGIPTNGIAAICNTIEIQLGDDNPIDGMRPVPGTPGELFAWARWFVVERGDS